MSLRTLWEEASSAGVSVMRCSGGFPVQFSTKKELISLRAWVCHCIFDVASSIASRQFESAQRQGCDPTKTISEAPGAYGVRSHSNATWTAS